MNNIVVAYSQGEDMVTILWKDYIQGNIDFLEGKIDAPPGHMDPNWQTFGRESFVSLEWQVTIRINQAYEKAIAYLGTNPTYLERKQLLLKDENGDFVDNPLFIARDILQRFDTYLFGGIKVSDDFEPYDTQEALERLKQEGGLGG